MNKGRIKQMGDMADNFSPGGMNAPEPEEKSIKNLVEYKSKIVGVTFEGRQEIIKMLTGDEPLRVRREPENEYDKKAVAVDAEIAETWHPIGYIAKDKNKDIAAALDAGSEVQIKIASLTGGDRDSKGKVKSYGVNIALSYTKAGEAKAEAKAEEPDRAPAELTDEQANDLNTLEQIKALLGVRKNTVKYTSRLLGKSTEVVVSPTGHTGLPGYMSGSKFPERFYPEFDKDGIIDGIIERHYGEESDEKKDAIREAITSMWNLNRDASTGYGTAIHAALENYDTYYRLGDKTKKVKKFKTKPDEVGPNKALSRNPFLKKIVEDFHEKFGGDYIRLNEQFVWLHEERLCGSIDRIKVIDADKKIVRIQDFKTDGDIHEKTYQLTDSPFYKLTQGKTPKMGKELLDLHWLQLSFYAYILKKHGYTVEGLDVYWLNPVKVCQGENAWEEFSHEVIDITGEV